VNKTELIEAISGDTALTRGQVESALDAFIYEVTAGVRAGNPVRITGFGTFKLRARAARRGRNPQTGAPVKIKASKGIAFTPGLGLKADLNARSAPKRPTASLVGVKTPSATKAAPAARAVPATKVASAAKAAPAKRATTVAQSAKKAAPAKKAPSATKATSAKKTTVATATVAKRSAVVSPAKKSAVRKSSAPAKKATAKRVS
jgi:DNA-binding protein HU-beta